VSLFVFGCSTGLDGGGVWSVPKSAQQLAADLADALNGMVTDSADVNDTTVTLKKDVLISKSITVPAGVTLAVAAGKTLTVNLRGSIVLTGDSSTPASLVLENNVDKQAKDGGGGKLVLIGVTGNSKLLGNNGDITVIKNKAHLTATGGTSGGVFTFAGAATELRSAGITNIDATTAKAFKSIIAATTTSADAGVKGKVIFKAADSGKATISKASQAKSKT
jgi:hypothetical protein